MALKQNFKDDNLKGQPSLKMPNTIGIK